MDGLIADTGLNPEDVDRLFLGNFTGELFVSQGHMGAGLVGTHSAFANKPSTRVEGACASGGLAIMSALDAIAAGADIVLVAGVEVQTTVGAREGEITLLVHLIMFVNVPLMILLFQPYLVVEQKHIGNMVYQQIN